LKTREKSQSISWLFLCCFITWSKILKNIWMLQEDTFRAHFGIFIPSKEKLPLSKVCWKHFFLSSSDYFSYS